jgi:biotin operon repressor
LERPLPPDVLRFIRDNIDRLGTLDVLLLLHATPAKLWTARQVSDELRSSSIAVQKALLRLRDHGLLVQDRDAFIFLPKTEELERSAARLAACVRERRTAVITAIFSRPEDAHAPGARTRSNR